MITKITRNTDGLRIHLFVNFLLKTHIKIRVEIRDSVTAVIKFIIKIVCSRMERIVKFLHSFIRHKMLS